MSYQIYNNRASIRFRNGTGNLIMMKWAVKEIAIIRGDTIRVSTGDCQSGIVFHYRDVVLPITVSANQLVDIMNGWLVDYDTLPGSIE